MNQKLQVSFVVALQDIKCLSVFENLNKAYGMNFHNAKILGYLIVTYIFLILLSWFLNFYIMQTFMGEIFFHLMKYIL